MAWRANTRAIAASVGARRGLAASDASAMIQRRRGRGVRQRAGALLGTKGAAILAGCEFLSPRIAGRASWYLLVTSIASSEVSREVAVQRLIAAASRRGFAIAADLLGNRAEAEDAVQDALVRTLTGLDRLRDAGALEGWFFRVLTNTCIRTLRRRRVAAAFARLVGARGDVAQPPQVLGGDHARVVAELDALPAMQKAALVLRYGHELGIDDIARILGVGAETVKTHLKRARARMRARMGVHDDR
ncbi:MAG TPA: RNA polymerase sigma factor [Kofleriaceae bacterium]|nr:RNA polymerase sigma factor [Kofleriaceae bacterium]